MAQPCSGSSANIFRSNRSRVPWTRSDGLLISRLHSVTEKHTMTPLGKQEECSKECLNIYVRTLQWKRSRGPHVSGGVQIARQPEVMPLLCRQWTLGGVSVH